MKQRLKALSKLDWILVSVELILVAATLVLEICGIKPYGTIVAAVTGVYSLVCLIYYNLKAPKTVEVVKEVVKYVEKPAKPKTPKTVTEKAITDSAKTVDKASK